MNCHICTHPITAEKPGWLSVYYDELRACRRDGGTARWLAMHSNCDPDRDAASYWIGLPMRGEAGPTFWDGHMSGKPWIVHTDWPEVIGPELTEVSA